MFCEPLKGALLLSFFSPLAVALPLSLGAPLVEEALLLVIDGAIPLPNLPLILCPNSSDGDSFV